MSKQRQRLRKQNAKTRLIPRGKRVVGVQAFVNGVQVKVKKFDGIHMELVEKPPEGAVVEARYVYE